MKRAALLLFVTLILSAGTVGHSAQIKQSLTTDFDKLAMEAGLVFQKNDEFDEIEPRPTPLYQFQKALRHRTAPFEIRYAIRPLTRILIEYSDPHNAAPNPAHIYPQVFQAMIGTLSRHGHSPTRGYLKKIAKKMFNADWAAASLFDTDQALNTEFSSALLLAIHKNKKGDAYILFLFNDAKAAKKLIDRSLDTLKFKQ